ncbi:MAG: type I restriction enzyme HsdR N-terminal domain-containing protein [Bacteroidetes bacterium]|nr:type I restriction enzyme HsdR N-terminal domain-containing protein [Bacteroidota bacterium]
MIYPPIKAKLKKKLNQDFIFDSIRKKWLLLTPEEFLRQHVVSWLLHQKKYPASLISLEKEIKFNNIKKRYDIVVYDRLLNPFIIIECKAPNVAIDISVLEQALRYNTIIKAPYLLISNGFNQKVYLNNNQVNEIPTCSYTSY